MVTGCLDTAGNLPSRAGGTGPSSGTGPRRTWLLGGHHLLRVSQHIATRLTLPTGANARKHVFFVSGNCWPAYCFKRDRGSKTPCDKRKPRAIGGRKANGTLRVGWAAAKGETRYGCARETDHKTGNHGGAVAR